MYYLMGCRSIQLNAEYDFKNKIKKIGFFNPRLSKVYIMPVSSIDDATKLEVEKDVKKRKNIIYLCYTYYRLEVKIISK